MCAFSSISLFDFAAREVRGSFEEKRERTYASPIRSEVYTYYTLNLSVLTLQFTFIFVLEYVIFIAT